MHSPGDCHFSIKFPFFQLCIFSTVLITIVLPLLLVLSFTSLFIYTFIFILIRSADALKVKTLCYFQVLS